MAFTIPNSADASSAVQAEPDSGDFEILVRGLQDLGVLDGCAVSAQGTPDMTVAVASGTVRIGGQPIAVTAGNVTITAASSSNPRLDLVTVDNAGTKAVVAGTAAASPAYPSIPADRVVLAAVYVPTSDTAIQSNQIIDKRAVVAPQAALLLDVQLGGVAETIIATFDAAAPSSEAMTPPLFGSFTITTIQTVQVTVSCASVGSVKATGRQIVLSLMVDGAKAKEGWWTPPMDGSSSPMTFTHVITSLAAGVHTVELYGRTENPGGAGTNIGILWGTASITVEGMPE